MLHIPTYVTVNWSQSDDRPQYQDAAFYRTGHLMTLSRNGQAVSISVHGDRRAAVIGPDGSTTEISTREEFRAAFASDDLMSTDLQWLNNPWFSVHQLASANPEEDVSYTADEAIDHALILLDAHIPTA